MYIDRNRYGYRSHIRRKRLIFYAAAFVIVGLLVTLTVWLPGKIRSGAGRERKELLQLWESGSYEEVYWKTRAALDSRPLDYFLLTMNGFSAYQLGYSQINRQDEERYFNDCIQALRKALLLKNSAHDGRVYYVLGKAYHYKGDSYADLSAKYLEEAKVLLYGAADIPEYLGLAYAALGDYRSSVEAFSDALGVQDPGRKPPGILLLSIAKSYFALDELDTARSYLQHCIEVSSDYQTVLAAKFLLVEIFKKADDIEKAKKLLQEIIAEMGDNAEAHYQLGDLYLLQGDTTRARAEWRLALRSDPAHARARTRLSQ